MRLISKTKLAFEVTHNGSTVGMQIYEETDGFPRWKTIKHEEVCNKNCSYRPTKGEQEHTLIKASRSPAFSPWAVYNHSFTTNPFLRRLERLESCSKCFFSCSNPWRHQFEILFLSRSNGWHHPFKWLASSVQNFSVAVRTAGNARFEIFRSPFQRLASFVWIFSCAVRTARVILSKFLQCLWNVYIRSNFFPLQLERLERLFLIRSLSFHKPFVFTVWQIFVSYVFVWEVKYKGKAVMKQFNFVEQCSVMTRTIWKDLKNEKD